ncbi:MAG TPA: single-stranded-DNA-specific exonuclease RecJ [Xanthobacteraceae bacterium]|nr:single-stranded-DNA-specific exonuclease RecJ [Xanthobacteraceae bacterium]
MSALPASYAPERAFLGVTNSVTGRAWRDRCGLRENSTALAIGQRYGLPEILARIIACRGVVLDEVEDFLDPSLRRLMPDPSTLTDMDRAAARLTDAAERKEKVAILGDYDVDGATSTALLVRVLRAAGLDPFFHIPDRLFEGYGPNVDAVRKIAERGATLLVTVDCGSTSFEALAEAAKLGLDVIVIDHHQVSGDLPFALAVVNPHRADDISGLGQLSAAGLVFMAAAALCRELRRRGFWSGSLPEPDLLQFLDLVALGTVADVVPLAGLNRAFVKKGLIALKRRESVGLRALMDIARLDGPPSPWHLGFLLGPRINAGGRIGDATLGTRLLVTDDIAEAARIANELDLLNRERQAIEKATLEAAEAEALAALGLEERGAVVIASGEGWHPGVVGLVAARLKERFGRPAFAIAMLGETGTGSARSIPGVDLGIAVRSAMVEGLLIKGGGHAMAAGLTVARDKLGALRAFLERHLSEPVAAARTAESLMIDAAITARAATPELIETVERAGPFGAGNPEPVFAFPSHLVAYADPVGNAHARVRLRSGDGGALNAIAFRALDRPLGQALIAARGQTMHLVGCLSIDRWQGQERVQLRILDAAPAEPLSAR